MTNKALFSAFACVDLQSQFAIAALYFSLALVQYRFGIPAVQAPAESSRIRYRQFWRYLLGMEQNVPPAGVFCKARREPKKKTPLLSSERAQERFLLCGSMFFPLFRIYALVRPARGLFQHQRKNQRADLLLTVPFF